jgi:hypothetical protein
MELGEGEILGVLVGAVVGAEVGWLLGCEEGWLLGRRGEGATVVGCGVRVGVGVGAADGGFAVGAKVVSTSEGLTLGEDDKGWTVGSAAGATAGGSCTGENVGIRLGTLEILRTNELTVANELPLTCRLTEPCCMLSAAQEKATDWA